MNQPPKDCLNTVDAVIDDIIAEMPLDDRAGRAFWSFAGGVGRYGQGQVPGISVQMSQGAGPPLKM